VPGYPKDKIDTIMQDLGYMDKLVVEGEQFHLWVIEGPSFVKSEFPSEKSGLNVIFTDDLAPYRTRKVRILNGANTSMVPVSYLYGIEYVRESVEDEVIGKFVRDTIFQEICPTLDLPEEELISFANDVLDRFKNPYLKHALISISLNSLSKFKTRVLPSLLEYYNRKEKLPRRLVFSMASLFAFYSGNVEGKHIPINDNEEVKQFFIDTWEGKKKDNSNFTEISQKFLERVEYWGQDLTKINGLNIQIANHLDAIINQGMRTAIQIVS
jgi:tagaturonate reductase